MSAKSFPPGTRIFRHKIYFPDNQGRLFQWSMKFTHGSCIEDYRESIKNPPNATPCLIVTEDVTRFINDPEFINAFNA